MVIRAPFVGRRAELSALAGLAAQAEGGSSAIALIEGPAGVGKTALLDAFLSTITRFGVIRASAEEDEREIAGGVLDQLLDSGLFDGEVADVRARAPAAREPTSAGATLLAAIDAAQQHGPLAVVVDGAQWVDTLSLRALLFAVRRLHADRVLTVFTARDDPDPRLDRLRRLNAGGAAVRLAMSGLDVADLTQLISGAGLAASARGVEQLREHTQGNPLHVLAVLEEVPFIHLGSGILPAPRSFSTLVSRKLADCSEQCRALATAAAVLGNKCGLGAVSALAGLDDPLPALDEAVRAGIVRARQAPGAMTVSFVHPLVRAAVYHAAGPVSRLSLHRSAAAIVDDPVAALDHRVDAATAPDRTLAAAVAERAATDLAAGEVEVAAERMLVAARLSPDPAESERRQLIAAECMIRCGDITGARRALGDEPAGDLSRRSWVEALLAIAAGRLADADRALERAWQSHDADREPVLSGQIANRLALVAALMLHPDRALEWAQMALKFPNDCSGRPDRLGVPVIFGVMGAAWRVDEASALVEDAILDEADRDDGPSNDVAARAGEPGGPWRRLRHHEARGAARLWTDDLVGARGDLLAAYEGHRALGLPSGALSQLSALCLAEYQLGQWIDALGHADFGLSLARDAELPLEQPALAVMAVLVHAGRGEWDQAERNLAAAHEGARAVGAPMLSAMATVSRIHLGRARGDHVDVVRSAVDLRRVGEVANGNFLDWQIVTAESLLALGRLDEADALLGEFEKAAGSISKSSSLAAAARLRARLCAAREDNESAAQWFRRSHAHAAGVSYAFDQALLDFDHGAFLRRNGRRRDAAAHLTSALSAFRSMGARPYERRAARELSSCGLRPAKRDGSGRQHLTPAELSVARLAASRLTNREIAAELVVSQKTVQFHLASVFRKLAISSRHELPEQLDDGLAG